MDVKEAAVEYLLEAAPQTREDDVPPGYRRTEVGVIPGDWEASTVGAEFTIQLGKMLDSEKNVGVSKPFLGNRAVQWGKIDVSDLSEVRLTTTDLHRYRLRVGDLLVCEGGEIGRSAIWQDELEECYYQKALHRLRSKRGYDPALLMNVLAVQAGSGVLQSYITQTSIAHLPKDKLETVPIPLPSKAEQRAIATALSDTDALIAALQRLIAKKRAIKQGTMQALLTGRQRLPGFTGEWAPKCLGSFGATYGGLTGKTSKDFEQGDTRYVPFMNVMTNIVIDVNYLENVDVARGELQSRIERGDLLFNGSSETPEEVGLCSAVMAQLDNVCLNSFCFGFRPEHDSTANPKYLAYYFRGTQGRELLAPLAQGATRYNLSKKALLRLEFPLPGPEEQTAIATVLADMDAEIEALEARLTKTRALKAGMMQQLLTGRIRLVKTDTKA